MNGMWSIDARVLVEPASTFHAAVRRAGPPGLLTALRRPLFIAIVVGTIVSLLTSGAATLRFTGPAAVYWSVVPAFEMFAVLLIIAGRSARVPLSVMVDLFFAGHGPWMLLLIAVGAIVPAVSPAQWWFLIIKVFCPAVLVVLIWSAYIDFCFFRQVLERSRSGALRDVVILRVMVWMFVFWLFAIGTPTPAGIADEIGEALKEIFR